jgi:hypothetical protein
MLWHLRTLRAVIDLSWATREDKSEQVDAAGDIREDASKILLQS